MYHPAAALHQRSLKSTIEADFSHLPDLIAKAEQVKEKPVQPPEEKEEPKQLSLF
jgi:DNA polymerase